MVTIKSTNSSSLFIFEIIYKKESEIGFITSIKNAQFNGSITATTLCNTPPSSIFNEIARDWRGWKGAKSWSDIEDRLRIEATSDGLGHINLKIEMFEETTSSQLIVTIQLEVGSLKKISEDIDEYFSIN